MQYVTASVRPEPKPEMPSPSVTPEAETPQRAEPPPVPSDNVDVLATPPTDVEDIVVVEVPNDSAPTKPSIAAAPMPPKEKPAQPKAKPKPETSKPSVPKSKSRRDFIDAGWNLVESNPGRAAKSFRQALELNRGDFEANYGYGYAMLKQGDPAEARHYLCIASGSNDKETQREVLAVLGRNGMSCN